MLVRSWTELEQNDGQQHQHAMLHTQIHKTSLPCCLTKCCGFRHWLQLFAAKGWTSALYNQTSSPAKHINSQEGWPLVCTGIHSLLLVPTDADITRCTQPQHAFGTSEIHLTWLDGNTVVCCQSSATHTFNGHHYNAQHMNIIRNSALLY